MRLRQFIIAALCAGLVSVTQAADNGPRYEPATCPLKAGLSEPFECGYLIVPADHNQPDGAALRLMVAVYPSSHKNAAADPIIYLNGGPGGSTIIDANAWMRSLINFTDRDLIFFDQRGTGFSEPDMTCPEFAENARDALSKRRTLVENMQANTAAFKACHDRLAEQGVDFTLINSAASAADVNDLRLALGYDQVNLLGVSYGTRLALTVMRDYPDGIRSVILDSVYPPGVDGIAEFVPNQQAIFAKVFAACAADSACNEKYPNLEAAFYELVDRWNKEPVTIAPPGSEPQVIDGYLLIQALFDALYEPTIIPDVPRLINAFYQGDTSELTKLTYTLTPPPDDRFSQAMQYGVQCREEIPFTDVDAINSPPDTMQPIMRQLMRVNYASDVLICDTWATGTADAVENEAVVSDIPTLLFTGEYDPITPASFADYAASTLSHSYNYQVATVSHAVLFKNAAICAVLMSLEFLDDPSTAPEQKCQASMPVDFH